MEHTEKTKIAASDINYYMQARLGTLSELEYRADVLLLPPDFIEGGDTISPYAIELSTALIDAGFKALMAIGPSVQQGTKDGDAAVLPHILIMNMYRERDIRAAIAAWMEKADLPKDSVSVTILGYESTLVAYPAITYSGTAKEVIELLAPEE
jgi:hypothetical protein